jgi:hypothetical protein
MPPTVTRAVRHEVCEATVTITAGATVQPRLPQIACTL